MSDEQQQEIARLTKENEELHRQVHDMGLAASQNARERLREKREAARGTS